jgi:hypothetical protein
MYKSKGIQKKKVQYAGNSIILHQNTFVSSWVGWGSSISMFWSNDS